MEQQDGPVRHAFLVDHGNGVGIDGDRLLAAAENRQSPQRLHAATDGRVDGAIAFADGASFFIAKPQQERMPQLAANAGARNARQPLGPAVPQHDTAGGVDEHYGVVHGVQEPALEHRIDARLDRRPRRCR